MQQSSSYNVVLLPGSDLADKTISASQQLGSSGTHFTLEFGKFYPHLSLFMFELKAQDKDKVSAIIERIAKAYELMTLNAIKYDQTKGFIDVEYNRKTELLSLQNEIIEAVNPLRNGMRAKDLERMEQAEGIKLEYFKQYGYPNVRELFRPHLTMTRFLTDKVRQTEDLPEISHFNGVFDRIGFFESGDNGTCIRSVSKFRLGI